MMMGTSSRAYTAQSSSTKDNKTTENSQCHAQQVAYAWFSDLVSVSFPFLVPGLRTHKLSVCLSMCLSILFFFFPPQCHTYRASFSPLFVALNDKTSGTCSSRCTSTHTTDNTSPCATHDRPEPFQSSTRTRDDHRSTRLLLPHRAPPPTNTFPSSRTRRCSFHASTCIMHYPCTTTTHRNWRHNPSRYPTKSTTTSCTDTHTRTPTRHRVALSSRLYPHPAPTLVRASLMASLPLADDDDVREECFRCAFRAAYI